MDGSGRTVVHAQDYDNLGYNTQTSSSFDTVTCVMRYGKSSLGTRYIAKL